MLDTIAQASTGATRQTLTWRALRPVVIEAVEAQDADSSALATIVVCPRGSTSLGAVLNAGPTAIPGGQIWWAGELLLSIDEEIRAYFDNGVAADRLFLTVKGRAV